MYIQGTQTRGQERDVKSQHLLFVIVQEPFKEETYVLYKDTVRTAQ
jgi:hypothetical protein